MVRSVHSDQGRNQLKFSGGKMIVTYCCTQWWDSNFLRTGSLTPGLINNKFSHYHCLQRQTAVGVALLVTALSFERDISRIWF